MKSWRLIPDFHPQPTKVGYRNSRSTYRTKIVWYSISVRKSWFYRVLFKTRPKNNWFCSKLRKLICKEIRKIALFLTFWSCAISKLCYVNFFGVKSRNIFMTYKISEKYFMTYKYAPNNFMTYQFPAARGINTLWPLPKNVISVNKSCVCVINTFESNHLLFTVIWSYI